MIFDLSSNIVSSGGLISMVLGHYIETHYIRGVSAVVFLFFFTVVLGLYLMMVTTVRTEMLTPHATYLDYLQKALLLATLIATLINGFPRYAYF
ncbi:hypothetical protein BAE44_0001492 [Dichanthelium oligosanthes]|uniref:Uncharacterized protein n=1 Tax=Dichanthelium oligosanthes TaxID=888268 RepID=A0A1E5WJA0_9POAL|nr:hypothetical protein BAE44_0001492 [Dichanthelium oligosanthes]